jgi:hypothetical protein
VALIPITTPVTGEATGTTVPGMTTLATLPNSQGGTGSYPVSTSNSTFTPFTGGAPSSLRILSGLWLLPAVAALAITGLFK